MSISSLYTFQSKVRTEESISYSLQGDLKSLAKSLTDVMDDRVGRSASESAFGISNAYSSAADNLLKRCNDAASNLERGYNKIDGLSSNVEKLLSDAQKLVKELGNLQ